MKPSILLRIAMATMRRGYKPILARMQNVGFARARWEVLSRVFLRGRWIYRFRTSALAGVSVRSGGTGPGTLMYIHGGAYVLCSARTHQGLAARLAKPLGYRAVLPDYRRSPENQYPDALDDVEAVYRALVAEGPVIIAGESAGGGLTLGLLHRICTKGLPMPQAVVAFSPWADLTLSGASISENEQADALLPASRMKEIRGWYLGDADPKLPDASPVFGDFKGAPRVLVQVAQTEILRSDAEAAVARLRACGVAAELDVLPHGIHGFQVIWGWLPEANHALRKVDTFLSQALAQDQAAIATRAASR
ncbi:alpha/beta hydrolase [Halovulum sp. GXIMD14793]